VKNANCSRTVVDDDIFSGVAQVSVVTKTDLGYFRCIQGIELPLAWINLDNKM